ncbi:MAG: gfo/Idh/MocA family oxidoreductase [Candidatus Altiarchaeales archaeon]|nr:MAG: gfo/Idh/MocA family oxidoreductase [Candidatus Altiarchaeales archaeon]
MKMKKLRAAVIGVGAMGRNHARVYSELDGTELVAVADANPKTSKNVAEDFRCKAYKDHREMLEEEYIDMVSIAVPTRYHRDVALDCIEKEIPILVEKPIADSEENAKEIIDKAGENGVKLTVGHIERFNPAVIELKKRLDKNELGKIFEIKAVRVGPFPNRIRDVGVVIDLAVHDIDIMRYLVKSEVKRLYAETERRIHTRHEDLLSGLLKFQNDVIGVLSVNWLTPEKIREISITGEKGMFLVKYLTQELYFYENIEAKRDRYSYPDILMGVTEGNIINIRIPKKEPLKAELESWIECVKKDKEPLVSGEDGLKALKLAQRLIDSAVKEKVIVL